MSHPGSEIGDALNPSDSIQSEIEAVLVSEDSQSSSSSAKEEEAGPTSAENIQEDGDKLIVDISQDEEEEGVDKQPKTPEEPQTIVLPRKRTESSRLSRLFSDHKLATAKNVDKPADADEQFVDGLKLEESTKDIQIGESVQSSDKSIKKVSNAADTASNPIDVRSENSVDSPDLESNDSLTQISISSRLLSSIEGEEEFNDLRDVEEVLLASTSSADQREDSNLPLFLQYTAIDRAGGDSGEITPSHLADHSEESAVEIGIPTTIEQISDKPFGSSLGAYGSSWWLYKQHPKGPRATIFDIQLKDQSDPHKPVKFRDPVFELTEQMVSPQAVYYGKPRTGEGNDITPNRSLLVVLGENITDISRKLVKLNDSSQKKEKMKLSSKLSRVRRKANHEANKIIFDGVETERDALSKAINKIKAEISTASKSKSLTRCYKTLTENLPAPVAGDHVKYVDNILDTVDSESDSDELE